MLLVSRRRRMVDIWPGFVDGLAALLMVVIFVLLLFSVGQFTLTDALLGRDRALDTLRNRIAELAEVLSLECTAKSDLENRLSVLTDELAATVKARDELSSRLQDMTAQADTTAAESERLRALLAENKQDRERLTGALQASREETEQQQELTDQAQTRVNELNVQIVALREQLLKLTQALETSEAKLKNQTIEIEKLGQRLNVALADKVEELAGYRSEFFGKLREALKENPDIRVEGDRFVLPSEVLFASASADLDAEGKREIAMVARTLKEITAKIPKDLDWVLRVDGHTDKRPIRVAFPSNWELSSARALSIVKYMIDQGIPANHLVAAGFGQYHPIDPAETADAYRRNRRIELKLTSR